MGNLALQFSPCNRQFIGPPNIDIQIELINSYNFFNDTTTTTSSTPMILQ